MTTTAELPRRRGRPARAGEPARCRIEFRVTRAERTAIQDLANSEGASVADWIRLVLLNAIADLDPNDPFTAEHLEMRAQNLRR